MRKYELAVLLHPDVEVELKPALARIEQLISDAEGKIIGQDNWGKQKLAYFVDKQSYGVYLFYTLELDPAKTRALQATLGIDDEVMRYLLVSVDEKAVASIAESSKAGDNKNTTKEMTARKDSKVKEAV